MESFALNFNQFLKILRSQRTKEGKIYYKPQNTEYAKHTRKVIFQYNRKKKIGGEEPGEKE